jgi:hypothetical protein
MILHLSSARAHATSALGRDARHLRRVARDPARCTLRDIELLLGAHGVPLDKIAVALDRLTVLGTPPPLAWAFVMAYDGIELADALADSLGTTSSDSGGTRG